METVASTFCKKSPFKLIYNSNGTPCIEITNNINIYTEIQNWTQYHYNAFINRTKFPNLFFYYFPSNIGSKTILWTAAFLEKLNDMSQLNSLNEGLYGYYGLFFGISGNLLYTLSLHYLSVGEQGFPNENSPLGLIEYASVPSAAYQVLIDDFFQINSAMLEKTEILLNEYLEKHAEIKENWENFINSQQINDLDEIKKIVIENAWKISEKSSPKPAKKEKLKSPEFLRENISLPTKRKKEEKNIEDNKEIIIEKELSSKYKQISLHAFISASRTGKFSSELLKLRNSAYDISSIEKTPKVFIKRLFHSTKLEQFIENAHMSKHSEIVNTCLAKIQDSVNEFISCKSDCNTDIKGHFVINNIPIYLEDYDSELLKTICEQYNSNIFCIKSSISDNKLNIGPDMVLAQYIQKISSVTKCIHEISTNYENHIILSDFLNGILQNGILLISLYKKLYFINYANSTNLFNVIYGQLLLCEKISENIPKSLLQKIQGFIEFNSIYIIIELISCLELNDFSAHILFLCDKVLNLYKKFTNSNITAASEISINLLEKSIFGHIHAINNFFKTFNGFDDFKVSFLQNECFQVNYTNLIKEYAVLYLQLLAYFYNVENIHEQLNSYTDFTEFLSLCEKCYNNNIILCQCRMILSISFTFIEPNSDQNLNKMTLLKCPEKFVESIKTVLNEYSSNDQSGIIKQVLKLSKILIHNFRISSSDLFSILSVFYKWIKTPSALKSDKLQKKEILLSGLGLLNIGVGEEKSYSSEIVCLAKDFIKKIPEYITENSEYLRMVKQTIAKLNMLTNIRGSQIIGIDYAKTMIIPANIIKVNDDQVIEEFLFYIQLLSLISETTSKILKQPQDAIIKRFLTEFNFENFPSLMKTSLLLNTLKIIENCQDATENMLEIIQCFMKNFNIFCTNSGATTSDCDYLNLILQNLVKFVANLPREKLLLKSAFLNDSLQNILSPKSYFSIPLKLSAINLISSIIPDVNLMKNVDNSNENEIDDLLLEMNLSEQLENETQYKNSENILSKELDSKWRVFVESTIDLTLISKDNKNYGLQVYLNSNLLLGKLAAFLLKNGQLKWNSIISRYASDKTGFWNPNNLVNKSLTQEHIIIGQIKFFQSLLNSAGDRIIEQCDFSTMTQFADKLIVYLSRALVLPIHDPAPASLHCQISKFIRCWKPSNSSKGALSRIFFSNDPLLAGPRILSWGPVFRAFLSQKHPNLEFEMLQFLRNLYAFTLAQLSSGILQLEIITTEWVQWIQLITIISIKYLIYSIGENSNKPDIIGKSLLNDLFELLLQKMPRKVRKTKGSNLVIEIQRFNGLFEIFTNSGIDLKSQINNKYLTEIYWYLLLNNEDLKQNKKRSQILEAIIKSALKLLKTWTTREQGNSSLLLITYIMRKSDKWIYLKYAANLSSELKDTVKITDLFEKTLFAHLNLYIELIQHKIKKGSFNISATLGFSMNKLFKKKLEFFEKLTHFRTDSCKKHQILALTGLLEFFTKYLKSVKDIEILQKNYLSIISHSHDFLVFSISKYILSEIVEINQRNICNFCQNTIENITNSNDYLKLLKSYKLVENFELEKYEILQKYIKVHRKLIQTSYKKFYYGFYREQINLLVLNELKFSNKCLKNAEKLRIEPIIQGIYKLVNKLGETAYFNSEKNKSFENLDW